MTKEPVQRGSDAWGTQNDTEVDNHQQTSLRALTPFTVSCLLLFVPPCLLQWSQAVSHWHPFHPTPHREPSELQGMRALEATAWALRVAEHELGIIPVLSAQAVVACSDPLGLIAYLSHFHSAFKNTPHSSGEWEGRWAGRRVRAGEEAGGKEVPPKGPPQAEGSNIKVSVLTAGLCLQALSASLTGPLVPYFSLANSRGAYNGPGPR